jgi:hypothetical protein
MGTFAETAIIDYRLFFADQENKLPFSITDEWRHGHGDIDMETWTWSMEF